MPSPTVLSPGEEAAFTKWRRTLPARLNETRDYDLRGFFHENPTFRADVPGQHLTDRFKLPNHDTFSNESKYYDDQTAPYGGKWEPHTDKSWAFVPNNPANKRRIDEDAHGNRMPMNTGLGGGLMGQMFMQPSETGRAGATVDDLASNVSRGKGDQWGQYLRLMQYLTQPKKDAGPAARRAMAGMPAGPRDADDPVELQKPGGGQALMSLLFGGLLK